MAPTPLEAAVEATWYRALLTLLRVIALLPTNASPELLVSVIAPEIVMAPVVLPIEEAVLRATEPA